MSAPPDMVVDILQLSDRLVSPFCGIIRRLHRIHKDPSEPERPFIWRAEIANHRFVTENSPTSTVAAGKGLERPDAVRSALGEAVERYCALRFPTDRMKFARRHELEGLSFDPRALPLYATDQYAELPYTPYDEDLILPWLAGHRLADSAPAWLPAQAIYLGNAEGAPTLVQSTSNGLAAGATKAAATLGALLEVIERDAFVISWYNRLSCIRVDWRSLPDRGVVALCEAYARRGVEITLVRLPSDHKIPVFAAVGVERGGTDPVAAVVGLGAHMAPARAAASAVLEIGQVRPALRIKLRDQQVRARRAELISGAATVDDLEDHDLLYTDPGHLDAFAPWLQSPVGEIDWTDQTGTIDDQFDVAIREFGTKAYAYDLTTPDIAELGLSVVRVLVEDMQPIHFGEIEIRLGGRRLFELPQRIGQRPGASTRAALNPNPHPLA